MDRISRIKKHMESLGYDNLLAFEPENIFYLTRFWGEGIALLNKNGLVLIVPKLEAERARKSKHAVIESERNALLNSLPDIEGRVCTDCNDHQTFKRLEANLDLVYDPNIFYRARMIKDEDEVRSIKKGAMLIDRLFKLFEDEVRIGMSELELQALLMHEGLRLGLQPASFRFTLHPLIIASGRNSSLPHAEPTSRKIRKGDLVTVDLTLRYNGYVADATRTFAIDSISRDKKEVYNIVKEAQEEGIANVRDGVSAREIDRVCRDVISKHGYAECFIHSTGHGIGVDVHEPPWISSNSNDILKEYMTITIEPAIYIKDRYGVRIEDSILITNKVEILNKYTKDLIII